MVSPGALFAIERGSGPPVVLLHGQPGRNEHLDAIAERLRDHATVISIDRSGYGRSDGSARPMSEQAVLIAERLRRSESEPAVIVAHSFAGGVALMLAAEHPELVDGLVLVGSIGGSGSLALIDEVMAWPFVGPAVSWLSLVAYGLVAPVLARVGNNTELSANVPAAPTIGLVHDLTAFVDEQRFLIQEDAALTEAIGRVQCRCIVIQGSLDSIVPPSAGEDLARRLRGGELVLLEGHGHLIPRDAPDRVAEAVLALRG